MKTVLLLSHSQDYFTIDRVADALRAAGVNAFRFNTDQFPEHIRLSERVDQSGSSVVFHTDQGSLYSREVDAVWFRKIWHPIINTPMEDKYLKASVKESIAIRTALFQSLDHLPWLDPIAAVAKASDKFLQLRLAQKAGLTIPRSIFSNDPQEVLAFFESLPGEMICKLHMPLSFGMDAEDFFMYTSKIERDDLDDLDLLRICPMIFQEAIPKAYELRVAYVDGQCFAGKIQTQDVMDWRLTDPQEVTWEAYDFPPQQALLLQQLMQSLHLSFGAIDLIVQPDGQFIFLEVNPVGEWGMLEKELNLPISQAIANGLIQRIS